VLANKGLRCAPYSISKVVAPGERKPLIENKPDCKQVISEKISTRTVAMLRGVINGGTGRRASLGARPVAGKTGSAQDYTSAFFSGFTPQLSTSVWVGFRRERVQMRTQFNGGAVFGVGFGVGATFAGARLCHAATVACLVAAGLGLPGAGSPAPRFQPPLQGLSTAGEPGRADAVAADQHVVEPLDVDGVRTVEVGVALWLLAFLALLPFYGRLEDAGNLWWLWTCLAGVGLGLLGLAGVLAAPMRAIHSRRLYEDEIVLVVHPEHRFAALSAVPVASLAAEPLLLAEEERAPEFNQFVIELCRSVGFAPTPYRGTVESIRASLDLVVGQQCVLCAPSSCVSPPTGIVWKPLVAPPSRYPWSVPGTHVDGVEAWLYPIVPSQVTG
jgi:hypothetical protein